MIWFKKILQNKNYAKKQLQYGLDTPAMTIYHREVVLQKKFLKNLYLDWYKMILAKIDETGKILELGSGGGFLKDVHPVVITSDVLPLPNCDLTISAYQLPFTNNDLSVILMINTFHHLEQCEKFISEAYRVLKKGGKIIMLEPANSIWSRFIYKHFHHESFDEKMTNWNFPSTGPLSGANGALPWIVFVRDKKKFQTLFPYFKIQSVELHSPFRYLLSGGLSYKSLLPSWMYKPIKLVEWLLSPLNSILAMFQTIELVKDN